MPDKIVVIQQTTGPLLADKVTAEFARGSLLYGAPFMLNGRLNQLMMGVTDGVGVELPNSYKIVHKVSTASWAEELTKHFAEGWVPLGGPFECRGLGCLAMTLGAVPVWPIPEVEEPPPEVIPEEEPDPILGTDPVPEVPEVIDPPPEVTDPPPEA